MSKKVVYLHRNPKTLEVYYVGMGTKQRANNMWDRNKYWINYTNKYGRPIVDIVASNLTDEDAWELEILLIGEIGRKVKGKGALTNILEGGCEFKGTDSPRSKRVLHLDLGEVFDSITEVMPYIEATHNHHVSSFFKGSKYHTARDLRVRLIDDDNNVEWIPEFDGIYDSGHEELTGVEAICNEYDYEADSEKQRLITSLTKSSSELSSLEKEILKLNILEGVSIAKISNKLGVLKCRVYSLLLKSKQHIKDSA